MIIIRMIGADESRAHTEPRRLLFTVYKTLLNMFHLFSFYTIA